VSFTQVGSLVREHRRELSRIKQFERTGTDHDGGAQPGHAVRRRGRMVQDQGARHLGVAVGEQRQQRSLTTPGIDDASASGHQHPAQQREQRQSRDQAQPAGRDQRGRLMPPRGFQCPGPQEGAGYAAGMAGDRQADDGHAEQGAYRGQAAGEPECLPEQDGGGWRPAWPGGSHQHRHRGYAAGRDCAK
jgi:hypothetical protein